MNLDKPKIQLILTTTDRVLDGIALGGLAILWTYTIVSYASLPTTIPTHFNFKGEIDNYGNKAALFILPVIMSLVVLGMTYLNKYPHIFNYPRKITAENAEYEYRKATRLIRIIKAVISIFAVLITITIVQSSKAGYSTMKWWMLPVFIIAMITPIIISLFSKKKNKSQFLGFTDS